jgi:hypothetical protein
VLETIYLRPSIDILSLPGRFSMIPPSVRLDVTDFVAREEAQRIKRIRYHVEGLELRRVVGNPTDAWGYDNRAKNYGGAVDCRAEEVGGGVCCWWR